MLAFYGPQTVVMPLNVNRLVNEHLVVMPVPERVTECGDPAALSVTVTAPDRVPVAVGVKVTLMVQDCPEVRVDPQPLD
jgi:hypothetical protein